MKSIENIKEALKKAETELTNTAMQKNMARMSVNMAQMRMNDAEEQMSLIEQKKEEAAAIQENYDKKKMGLLKAKELLEKETAKEQALLQQIEQLKTAIEEMESDSTTALEQADLGL